MRHTARQRLGWSGAFVVIIVCSLVPVVWIISLSLKTPADGHRRQLSSPSP